MEPLTSFFLFIWFILVLVGLDKINKNLKKATDELKEIKFRIQK